MLNETRPRVLHLVDDTTAGGVMRVVDFILSSPELSVTADHQLAEVGNHPLTFGRYEADVIVSHLSINWRSLPRFLALRGQHPMSRLIHVEHSYTEEFVALNVPSRRRFAQLLRLSYRVFDTVVGVSDAQSSWLVDSGFVSPDAITTIRSCVDLSAFRTVSPAQGKPRIIGAIGRLHRQKGFDVLIKALRKCQRADIELHVYGTGEDEPYLRRLAAGDERIHFKGFAADPVAAIGAVDVVAMPSRWEAYGLVAIEALAAGRHLLVSEIDGLRDHLRIGAAPVCDLTPDCWEAALEGLFERAEDCTATRADPALERDFIRGWRALLAG